MKREILLRAASVIRELWLMLGITILALVGLEIVARFGFGLRDFVSNGANPQIVDESQRADVYAGQDWAAEYWREESLTKQTTYAEWRSYVYWRRKPYQGKYINVDQNGIRATWNKTTTPFPSQVKVLVFGGSTLWGTGARDEYTIPSFISKKLSAKNVDAWVTNMGEGGYVSTQEVIALLLELQKGNVPDLVIFYDGANDAFSAYQQGVAGIPQNEYNRVQEFNQLNWRGAILDNLALYRAARGLVDRAKGSQTHSVDDKLANAVVDRYVANIRFVQSLAQSYGFVAAFFWQPVIYNKKNLTAWERQQLDRYGEARFFQAVDPAEKQRAISTKYANFIDLSGAFGNESGPVFIDAFHISEAGNDHVADLILQTLPQIMPRLKISAAN
jgi:lysophospholipase L1-like esterase